MTFIAPSDNGRLYEQMYVGGRLWSGLVEIEGCDRIYEWQKQKAKGSSGAKLNFQGQDVPTIKLKFKLWKGTDWLTYVDYFDQWDKFESVFLITVDDKNPQAITIDHPQFARAGYRSVVVAKIGDLVYESAGLASITVEVIPFTKPKPCGGTPKQETTASNEENRPKSKAWQKFEERFGVLGDKAKEYERIMKSP